MRCNVLEWKELRGVFSQTKKIYGHIDIVYANAGTVTALDAFDDKLDEDGELLAPNMGVIDVCLKSVVASQSRPFLFLAPDDHLVLPLPLSVYCAAIDTYSFQTCTLILQGQPKARREFDPDLFGRSLQPKTQYRPVFSCQDWGVYRRQYLSPLVEWRSGRRLASRPQPIRRTQFRHYRERCGAWSNRSDNPLILLRKTSADRTLTVTAMFDENAAAQATGMGLTVNTAEYIALGQVFLAGKNEWNGKCLTLIGGKASEVEAPLEETRSQWYGKHNTELAKMAQSINYDHKR